MSFARACLAAAALALLPLAAGPALAQGEATPITIGQSYRLESEAMGTERTINVWLPPGYAESGERYPVLYLLDGGVAQDFPHIAGIAQLGTIGGTTRDFILVGVETVDRRRELAFPTTDPALRKDYPTAGHSAEFRRFLAEEVKPWAEASYRTSGEDAVIGESLAGLFVVETFLKSPGLFDKFIAISPSLWWDNESLAKESAALLAAQPAGERWLWLALADEKGMGLDPLLAALKAGAPESLRWHYDPRPQESHATIYHPAALTAIRALFAAPGQH